MPRVKGSKNGVIGNAINKREFENLCALLCTMDEIASVFNTTYDTLLRWCKENYDGKTFEQVWKEKSAVGKISLRRAQFRLAESNANMAIFLGKNYLNQNADEDGRSTNSIQLINVQVVDANQYKSKVEQIENEIVGQLAVKEPIDS